MEVDPWEDVISATLEDSGERILAGDAGGKGWPGQFVLSADADGNPEWRVSSSYLLTEVLGVSTDRQHNSHWTHLANVMTKLGWAHAPGPIRIGTKTGHGFTISALAEEE